MSAAAGAWRRLTANRAAVAGGIVVLFMTVVATLFPVISRYGTRFDLAENHPCLRNLPPGARAVPREFFLTFSSDDWPFDRIDTNASGTLDSLELSRALRSDEFARYDSDGDGDMEPDELRDMPRSFLVRDFDALHTRFDRDDDGRVSVEEADPFADVFPVSEAAHFVRRFDADRSGVLDRAEFGGLPRPRVFLLGSDGLGRDLMTRMVYGARVSLLVGLLATLVSALIGVSWGAIAGYFGGKLDAVMMRIVDVIYGLPFMFLVILLMVVFGRHFVLLFVAIGAVSWLTMSRIVRGQVISLKNQEFVHAARVSGTSDLGIIFRHVIPNAMGPIIVYATLTVPAVMIEEAFLSFIGLGVQAPYTSWGALASDGASPAVIVNYPWLTLFPGLALAITLLSLNFLGDGVRDALDPRSQRDE